LVYDEEHCYVPELQTSYLPTKQKHASPEAESIGNRSETDEVYGTGGHSLSNV
jgi:hypothetical protein